MDPIYLIIALAIVLLPAFLSRVLSGGSGDSARVLGAEPRSRYAGVAVARNMQATGKPPPAQQPRPTTRVGRAWRGRATRKEVMRLVKAGRKADAVRFLRDQTGMGLEQAQNLIDRLG